MDLPRLFGLHQKGIELVPVGIAEVAGVETAATVPGRAFVTAAVGERDVVEALNLRFVPGFERDHHAIADRRGVAVERLGEANARAGAWLAPRDELLILHHAADTQLAAERIIEFRRLFTVVRAKRHIANHHVLLSSRVENIRRTESAVQSPMGAQACCSQARSAPDSVGPIRANTCAW